MTKEALSKLIKYADSLRSRISSPVPESHKDHPRQYKEYLEKDLAATKSKIDAALLDGVYK